MPHEPPTTFVYFILRNFDFMNEEALNELTLPLFRVSYSIATNRDRKFSSSDC